MSETPCANGHVWTNRFGDDWTPDTGTPCDCRQTKWAVEGVEAQALRYQTEQARIEALVNENIKYGRERDELRRAWQHAEAERDTLTQQVKDLQSENARLTGILDGHRA